MTPSELAFYIILIVLLVSMGGYFAWRQLQTLKQLQAREDQSEEDRTYLRRQAHRRLIGSGLMILFAMLLVGGFSLEGKANELAAKGQQAKDRGEKVEFSEEEKDFRKIYSWYWITLLLALLLMLGVAAVDFLAIWRYGRRHYQKLQSDRREMISGQLDRLRSERNGQQQSDLDV